MDALRRLLIWLFKPRPQDQTIQGAGAGKLAAMVARATVSTGPPASASNEEWIEWLKDQQREASKDRDRLRERIRQEERARQEAVGTLRQDVAAFRREFDESLTSLGEVTWEWVGFLWLLVGTSAATFW
jgi:hypothetical protein